MPSVLKRWLTRLNPRTSSCKDATGSREPVAFPTRYPCKELATEFVRYWTKITEDDGEGLEDFQLSVISHWNAFQFPFGKRTDEHPLPLDFFARIFDDYFFQATLRPYIQTRWINDTRANRDWIGATKQKVRYFSTGPPEIRIQVKRPPGQQLWTRALIQDHLSTLLHEMVHALLMIYSIPVGFIGFLGGDRGIAEAEGVTGHGPCWVEIAVAVAREADRALGGLWHKWDLGMDIARRDEMEALGQGRDREGLDMMESCNMLVDPHSPGI